MCKCGAVLRKFIDGRARSRRLIITDYPMKTGEAIRNPTHSIAKLWVTHPY